MTLTRRQLFFATGSGVLGVALVSTGCSSSTTPPATTPPTAAEPAASAPPNDWHRVEMAIVSAYLLVRPGGETAVVDLGTEGSLTAIEAGLKAAGSGWGSVRHIFLTSAGPAFS
jgi:glyoxylase-like metal-dependent hydrolase (beta-lactamase superfamily II)